MVTEGVGRWIVQAISRTRLHVLIIAFLGHLAAARLANNWELGDRLVSPLWPAAGVSVGLTLIVGKKWWLVVAGAAIGKLVNVIVFLDITSPRPIAALLTAQTAELIVAAMIGQYLLRPPEASRRAVRTIRLVLLGSMFAAAVGAGLIAALSGFDNPSRVARDWFIGDGLGILVAAPAIYSLTIESVRSPRNRFAAAELGVSLTLLTVLTIVGFETMDPLIVLVIPVIAWLAVRFGPIASTPSAFVVLMWGTWQTSQGEGPFTTFDDPVVTVQYFTAAVALTGVFVAAQSIQDDRQHRRLTGLVKMLPEAIFVIDDDGVILEDYTEGPTGDGSLVGQSGFGLATPDTERQLELSHAILSTAGRATATTEHVSRTTGKTVTYETKFIKIGPHRSLAVGRDITHRVSADKEVAAQGRRWRELMNASFQGLAEIDAAGNIEDANSRFASTLGLQASEILRRHLNDVIDLNIWPTWPDDYEQLLAGKRISQHIEQNNRTAVVAMLPQTDSAGHFQGAIAISLDTT